MARKKKKEVTVIDELSDVSKEVYQKPLRKDGSDKEDPTLDEAQDCLGCDEPESCDTCEQKAEEKVEKVAVKKEKEEEPEVKVEKKTVTSQTKAKLESILMEKDPKARKYLPKKTRW